ncbi:uncharacterized protein LOC114947255 [Acropora millepora]|uniref:uncharacterized protein LOC114947255 n=1 Tax=Acropora millepora TaxID=45264 RepID=UPI001CF2B06E|nr:uncharacterized protein LOC114947255 [Acropora millepora]
MMSEASCGALCQHPECWRANLQRVKDAVKLRNGIYTEQNMEQKQFLSTVQRSDHHKDGSLPTLKVVDMFNETALGDNSKLPNTLSKPNPHHQRSASLPSLSPNSSQPLSPSHSPSVPVPRPSPVSPAVQTDYQKGMLWKRNAQSTSDSTSAKSDKQHASIVGVHELYEADELLQDWKDVYITSAYLVWCQNHRRKKRKAKSTGSIRKDPRRVTFKDVTEDMIPATMEKSQPKRPERRRSPTVGLPFSPSRASSYRPVHVQQLDLAEYGLEDFGDFPKSVIAGILQHLNPNKVPGDKELPLGLEAHPKPQLSSRARDAKKTQPSSRMDQNKQQTLEQTVNAAKTSRMLLDIDINSQITSPAEETAIDEKVTEVESTRFKQETNAEPKIVKATREKLLARQGRVMLPLASVGIPTQRGPKMKLHHCTNSIPRILDLSVAMEPVDVVSVTPTPSGTTIEDEAETQDSQLCILDDSAMERILFESEPVWPNGHRYHLVRGHVTSALRYSPRPVRAPAPTPMSPERYGHFGRTTHSREHANTLVSQRMTSWDELICKNDGDELVPDRGILGRPGDDSDELPVDPVFITEEVTHVPTATPVSIQKGTEELPEDKMIINYIEDTDDISYSARSPTPGSKTVIPRDILSEFHGDLYGRNAMLARHKMKEKQRIARESHLLSDASAYIAPAWRTPLSRTPIPLSETPSRKAPKPLRQPPAESVPRSLSVQPIAKRTLQRPRSSPPGASSSRGSIEIPLQQILSDSSLVNTSRDNTEGQSMIVQASSSTVDSCGSIPPPPSPEVPIVAGLSNKLDPLSEVEERSSLASASVADGTSQVDNCDADNIVNQSEVHEDNEGIDSQKTSEKVGLESIREGTDVAEVAEIVPEEALIETEEHQTLDSQQANHDPILANQELSLLNSDSITSETRQNPSQAPSNEQSVVSGKESVNQIEEAGNAQDEIFANTNATPDESNTTEQPTEEEAIAPPHPPESPDIINTPDFTEGLDMTLDMEAQLRAAMEGLDDFDESETEEEQSSPKLEGW